MTTSATTTANGRPAASSGALAARIVDGVKVYGRGDTAVRALDGIRFDFPSGQFSAVMGPSGSGKSTLMHCMAGLDRLTSGEAWVGDTELSSLGEKQLVKLRRHRVGFVFQAFNLVPTLTARENINLPLALAGDKPDGAWFDTIVDKLGIRDRLTHRPNELSGGQQQRVAIARALVTRPAVVFADEPTGNLDTESGAEVLAMLRRAVDDDGQTIIMVTHDAGAAAYADRVVYLVDGRIALEQAKPGREGILDTLKQLGDVSKTAKA